MTADRKPKSTYPAVRDTYAEFERLASFMSTRSSKVEVLVSDQAIDRWRGAAGTNVGDVCRELYRRGVSFRLVSLLRPQDLSATRCKKLLLLDSTIPDEPDGSSPARQALVDFAGRGGHIRYVCDQPWRGLYLPDGSPPSGENVETVPAPKVLWNAVEPFIGTSQITVDAGGAEIFWRELRGAGRRTLLLVAVGPDPVPAVTVRGVSIAEVISADGAKVAAEGRIVGLNTYALFGVR